METVNERQQKFGTIPVVAVNDTTNVEKVGSSITFMGEIIGAQDKAKQLTDFNDKYLNMVHDRASKLSDGDKKPFTMLRVMTDFKPILPIQPTAS